MPYKLHDLHRRHINKQPSLCRDWPLYNQSLKDRGDITIWLSDDAIANWYEQERIYDGTGTPHLYSDMAILTAHEIRQVFKLPLRQCEGFVNSLFKLMHIELRCPSYSVMSKRLKRLNLIQPFYRKSHFTRHDLKLIAIDSSGLKCYGHEEWHSEKYPITAKKQWKKLHLVVDQNQIIHSSVLSSSHIQDVSVVTELTDLIKEKVRHVTADTAYDGNPTYRHLSKKFPSADIVISLQKDSSYQKKNSFYRNRNIEEIKCYGRMGWQKRRNYGLRNHSELAIQRYKRILGNRLHARDFSSQKQEAIIGCSILNKMTSITLEKIRSKF